MSRRLSLVLVVILSLVLVQVVSADTPAPGGPFSSSFTVQNQSSSTANCSYTFYDSAGTAAYTSSLTSIGVGDSMFVYVPNILSLASGTYSGVVSCDQEVAAVTNFSDSDSGASHSGIRTAGSTWYIPNVFDNYYNYYTTVIVQNATGSAQDITLDIYPPGSSTPVKSQTQTEVPAYASVSFEQEGLAELSNNVAYSARVTAADDVAAIVNIYGRSVADNQLYSYNAVQSGATTVYVPQLMNNYYGYNTSLTVQNIGADPTHVTVTYGTGETQEADVPGYSSNLFYTPSSGVPSGDGPGLNSATVTSTSAGYGAQPIVALINESNGYNRAASYIGFAAGATTVRTPIVMKRYYSYNTSVVCQVLSGGPATLTIEYFGAGGASLGTNTSGSKSNGQTQIFYQPNEGFLSDDYNGSAVITSAAQIACVVNEDQNEAPQSTTSMDQLYAYEGVLP
jgi:hypothetical protein